MWGRRQCGLSGSIRKGTTWGADEQVGKCPFDIRPRKGYIVYVGYAMQHKDKRMPTC